MNCFAHIRAVDFYGRTVDFHGCSGFGFFNINNALIQLRASTAGFTALQNGKKNFQLVLTAEQLEGVLTADEITQY